MSEKRSMLQVRRKEARAGGRDPFYCPERDLAYCGPSIASGAMHSLEEKWWEPWFKQFLADNDISYDDMLECEAPLKLATAFNSVINQKDPPTALAESGFSDLPPAMQVAFYTRLGQVFLAGVWTAVKDVNRPDSDPPVAFEEFMDDMNTAYKEFLAKSE